MTFDPVAFVNTLISALIGVVTALVIAHWYFVRSAPVERILKELKQVIPHYLHPVRYPQFYSPSAFTVAPEQGPPTDKDIPHVTYAVFTRREIQAGSQFEVLLNILDTGRNFDNPQGLALRDHLEREVAAQYSGLGFARALFTATPIPTGSSAKITIRLTDTVGKHNVQTLPFHIAP